MNEIRFLDEVNMLFLQSLHGFEENNAISAPKLNIEQVEKSFSDGEK